MSNTILNRIKLKIVFFFDFLGDIIESDKYKKSTLKPAAILMYYKKEKHL